MSRPTSKGSRGAPPDSCPRCLSAPRAGGKISSFGMEPLTPPMEASDACVSARLSGSGCLTDLDTALSRSEISNGWVPTPGLVPAAVWSTTASWKGNGRSSPSSALRSSTGSAYEYFSRQCNSALAFAKWGTRGLRLRRCQEQPAHLGRLVTLLVSRFSFFRRAFGRLFRVGANQGRIRPVAVITTSGTAAAELLPAMVRPITRPSPNRSHGGSAAPLPGTGAPQAIEQKDLFSAYARVSLDWEAEPDWRSLIAWNAEGPAHLNVCFEEPLPGIECRQTRTAHIR